MRCDDGGGGGSNEWFLGDIYCEFRQNQHFTYLE
jgi:hypothetical protein